MLQLKTTHLLPFLLFFYTIACTKEKETNNAPACEAGTIDLDTIRLSAISASFVPYSGTEKIFFKNAAGEEVKFEPLFPPKSHIYFKSDFELTCDAGGINYYEYIREQYVVSHICTALNLEYYLNVYPYNSSIQPKFVDEFSLTFHTPPLDHIIDTAISLNLILDYKGNEDLKDEVFDPHTVILPGDVTLLNKTFTDVYKVTKPAPYLLRELYFNKAYGIIGFKDLDGVLWVYDRVE